MSDKKPKKKNTSTAVPLTLEATDRGFAIASFIDLYGKECSIQKSSLASEDCIWLGQDDARMHLTRDMAEALLPLLKTFVKTGELT